VSRLLDSLAQIGSLCRKEMLALVKEPASRAILVVPALRPDAAGTEAHPDNAR